MLLLFHIYYYLGHVVLGKSGGRKLKLHYDNEINELSFFEQSDDFL
jgi:hypothetical protein